MAEYSIQSEGELQKVATDFAEQLSGGQVVSLRGELGAGKTAFVRALAKVLNVTEPVSSPTYVLQHEYYTPDGVLIEHWDLYRLTQVPEELLVPADSRTVRLIEWAEKFATQLGPFSFEVQIERIEPGEDSLIDSGVRKVCW